MTTPFSGNLETEIPVSRPESSDHTALAQQVPGLQVGEIPAEMRGADTANLPNVTLTAYTNVPGLINPDKGVQPVPRYNGWPYNKGYVPIRR